MKSVCQTWGRNLLVSEDKVRRPLMPGKTPNSTLHFRSWSLQQFSFGFFRSPLWGCQTHRPKQFSIANTICNMAYLSDRRAWGRFPKNCKALAFSGRESRAFVCIGICFGLYLRKSSIFKTQNHVSNYRFLRTFYKPKYNLPSSTFEAMYQLYDHGSQIVKAFLTFNGTSAQLEGLRVYLEIYDFSDFTIFVLESSCNLCQTIYSSHCLKDSSVQNPKAWIALIYIAGHKTLLHSHWHEEN